MRVLHLITRMIVGGAQENTLLTCRGLIERHGDDVLLATGPSLGPEGDLLSRQPDHGVEVEVLPSLVRPVDPRRDTIAYHEIRSILRRFRPDVVHTHSAKAGILGRIVAWGERVPAVLHTVHGAPFGPFNSWPTRVFYRACERYAAARCHRLISVADAMTDSLVAAGVAPRSKFVTIYSGMEVEPFRNCDIHRQAARSALGLDDSHVVVGKIARLFALKGHDDVLEAARQACLANPHLRFLFVGDGALRSAIMAKLEDYGLMDRFRFTGLVPPADVPKWLSAMDVLVHASLREGLARALPQALIAGRPVISYDIDGAREVVLDGVTGRLLRPGDIRGLSDAIAALASDPERRRRWGQEGQRRFTERFRHETMTDQIRAVYQRVLDHTEGRAGQLTDNGPSGWPQDRPTA